MLRTIVVVAAAVVCLAGRSSANPFSVGTVPNRFIVTYGLLPFGNFHTMPRTTVEAAQDHFSQFATRSEDSTTVWCRDKDYRVCVLFDRQGSVAGIQTSVKASEIANVPSDLGRIPDFFRQTFLDEDVYSTIAFFVSKDILTRGGRPMTEATLTAPEGIYILQTDDNGVETGRLLVSTEQSDALSAGFTEQTCFIGMGKHYFQGLKPNGTCEGQRPYFLLYGPATKKLNGFGVALFGRPSKDRRAWFESPPSAVAKKISPNSPDCLSPWIDQYGLTTFHIYFVPRPYFTWC